MLALEGGAHPPALAEFLERTSVPPGLNVARGTIWPRATVFHLPATRAALEALAEITQDLATPEICWHLHVYDEDGVVLEWFDALEDAPMWLSKRLALPGGDAVLKRTVASSTLGRRTNLARSGERRRGTA